MHFPSIACVALAALVSAHEPSLRHRQKSLGYGALQVPFSPSSLLISQDVILNNQPPLSLHSNHSTAQSVCPNGHTLKAVASPWVSPPHCMFAATNTSTEPVCAFVSHSFANGRGIALLTTPSRAAQIISSKAFTTPRFPRTVNAYASPPFEELDLPGRGKGLIANKTLYSGDRLFASTPVLIIDPAVQELDDADRLSLSHHAVNSLPAATAARFWALAAHTGADPFDDRVDTNSFGIDVAGVECWVIFPEIARLNHDCRPNAAYFFDPTTLTQHVHVAAPHPIAPGTELTITYLDNTQPRAARQRKARHNWGFPCTCSLCSLPPPLARASDARLSQIANLTKTLGDWRKGSGASVGMALALVDLVEIERLGQALPDAYLRVALQYSGAGDRWEAVRWANRALAAGLVENGWRDAGVRKARRLAEAPEAHWSWGVRVGGGGIDYVEEDVEDEDGEE